MPFKHYHGRTGVVFNVTPRALGVIVNKEVNGKIIKKRINVRVEHVKPSKCQKENKGRALINDTIKRSVRGEELHAKHQRCYESLPQDVKQSIMNKERVNLVRTPIQPRKGYICKLDEELTTIQPAPFSDLLLAGVHGDSHLRAPCPLALTGRAWVNCAAGKGRWEIDSSCAMPFVSVPYCSRPLLHCTTSHGRDDPGVTIL
eukprot:scaffold8574_cov286-Pinguiococcus_pyrenoidosus.AAC.2